MMSLFHCYTTEAITPVEDSRDSMIIKVAEKMWLHWDSRDKHIRYKCLKCQLHNHQLQRRSVSVTFCISHISTRRKAPTYIVKKTKKQRPMRFPEVLKILKEMCWGSKQSLNIPWAMMRVHMTLNTTYNRFSCTHKRSK